MESLDYWRLCDELSILQAAFLLIGLNPSDEGRFFENWEMEEIPREYEAAKVAIIGALRKNKIEGKLIPHYENDYLKDVSKEIEGSVDIYKSLVDVETLRQWLKSRGVCTGFFFPEMSDAPDYLDPRNPRYAPKLAAAVRAWQSVVDVGGKHPKNALRKWLREHAAEYGLTDDKGKLNETGIEEAAKVANWQPSGGAPKTPGE